MITSRGVRQFLQRRRFDYAQWKNMPDRQIEARRRALPVDPPIWTELTRRQKICFLLGVKHRRFAFFNDTGEGKTMLCIALSRYFRATGETGIFLALVPNKSNKSEWAREIAKHSPSSKCLVLTGSSVDKWGDLFEEDADIVVETYAGLMRMLCDLIKKKRAKKPKLVPVQSRVTQLSRMLCGMFLDESTVTKNHRKLPFRICRKLAKVAEYVFPLSGTPFGRDPIDLWAQMFLVDGGYTLGETLGLFRAAFFTEAANFWGGKDYTFNTKKEGLLHEFLAHRSIRYEADKKKMPRPIRSRRYASLPEDAQAYYAKAREALLSARGDFKAMENQFMRMRQISSGFIGYRDDITGIRASFEFGPKPKLENLISHIRAKVLPIESKAIVFHDFIFSGRIIAKRLERERIGYELLNGKTKDSARVLQRFDNDPECDILLLNNAAGGFGLNLQVAKWGLFYESPVGAILRRQTERRFHRQGSLHDWVGLVDFLTRGTVDDQILDYHAQGGSLFAAIVNGAVRPR